MAENQVEGELHLPFTVTLSLAGEVLRTRDLTLDLTVPGLFVGTDRALPPGTAGEVTLRSSQWDAPFTLQTEVLETLAAGEGGDTAGLLLRFVQLDETARQKLERLMSGVPGTVADAIRRGARESGQPLLDELRRRPASQRIMFAHSALGHEIDAILRDGLTAAVERLLENPRLDRSHVCAMLRDPRTPPRLLLRLQKEARWMREDEIKMLWAIHPQAPLVGALALLAHLSPGRLQQVERLPHVRPQLRQKARDLRHHQP